MDWTYLDSLRPETVPLDTGTLVEKIEVAVIVIGVVSVGDPLASVKTCCEVVVKISVVKISVNDVASPAPDPAIAPARTAPLNICLGKSQLQEETDELGWDCRYTFSCCT
jgi:hypothetical protein